MIERKKYLWIDALKTASIIAVVIDHLYLVVIKKLLGHGDYILNYATLFSISAFIFISGVNTSLSMQSKDKITFTYIMEKVLKIFIPYVVATIIVYLIHQFGSYNVKEFIAQGLGFKASAPFYYVLVYIELILISPLLFLAIKRFKKNYIMLVVLYIAISAVSYVFYKYIHMNFFNLAASRLFGGTCLLLFFSGMLFAFFMDKITSKIAHFSMFGLSIVGLLFFFKQGHLIDAWSNPPNQYILVYTALLIMLFFSFFSFVKFERPFWSKFAGVVTIPGKRSLYIFLYHITVFIVAARTGFLMQPKIINFILLAVIAIAVGLLISYIADYIKKGSRAIASKKKNKKVLP